MDEKLSGKKLLQKSSPKQVRRAKKLRQEMTPPEVILWHYLRPKYNKSFKVRRQAAVLPGIIVDFYIDKKKIAIEVDGKIHNITKGADAKRDVLLKQAGVTVLRIPASRVFSNPQAVAELVHLVYLGEIDPKLIEW